VAVDDIRSQLREAEGEVDLEVVRVSMSRPADVAAALRRATDAHAIVITRGGGDGVHVLDDGDLIRAVAGSPVPVAVALGHASDDLVVGRVADAAFPTPTAFGVWLRSVIEEKRARHIQAEEGKLLLQSQSVLDQLRGLQASAARWHLVALVAVAALVVAVVWFLLRSP
jgi:exonuclease VII large subunit